MFSHKAQQRERTESLRGWIVYFLYKARPKPLELPSLMRLLDRRNYPVSRRRLAEEIDYLRSLKLLRVFPSTATSELDEIQQAKWIQKYADSDSDEEIGDVLCVRITTAGINFQDGLSEYQGIARVD
ncbi:MAG: hypothetical protein ABW007_27330 [Chitinophagaceae bacterium]